MRVVVVGGYGNFGARICRALCELPRMHLIATGRRPNPAKLPATVSSAFLDLDDPGFATALHKLSPDLVIHCAGPFQGQDYRVAMAALRARAHYIDISDGRAFVEGFSRAMDLPARENGVLMVSGASTLPGLSSAVVDALRPKFRQLEEIRLYIAPGQRAPRGDATLAGVFTYAGRSFRWLRDGEWRNAWGWQELSRVSIQGVGRRWAAACDVPDLGLFPVRYAGVGTVEFRAALELGVQHFALWLAAFLRRAGVPLPIERMARGLNRVASMMDRFGGNKGGMLVSLSGIDLRGNRTRMDWNLVAEAGRGPEIPCMAAILLARKLAHGDVEARGAFACMGFLSIEEFAPEFSRWGISTTLSAGAA